MLQTKETITRRPLVVTVDQAAEMLATSRRTVWRLISTGDLPAVRIRGSTRIRIEAIDALIARGGTP